MKLAILRQAMWPRHKFRMLKANFLLQKCFTFELNNVAFFSTFDTFLQHHNFMRLFNIWYNSI